MRYLFFIYLAALAAGLLIRKARRRYRTAGPPSTLKGQVLAGLLRAAVIIIVLFAGVFSAMVSTFVYDYRLIFTDAVKNDISEHMGVVINDDVRPLRYMRFFGGAGDGASTKLELETDLNEYEFTDKCLNGEVIEVPADSDISFIYKYGNTRYSVIFDDGSVIIVR